MADSFGIVFPPRGPVHAMHATVLALHLGSSAVSVSENHEGQFCTGVHDGADAVLVMERRSCFLDGWV